MQADFTFIDQLKKGEVISSDIYFNKTLLIKAGTIVNDGLIKNLQNWGITHLSKMQIKKHENPGLETEMQPTFMKREKIFYSKELFHIKKLFYEGLQYVVSETRYGLILNSDAQLVWLENLFISSLLDSRISMSLFRLKKKDPYSYFHSFDVFLLGALLAEASGIKDIHSFAIGCLIHDIGKLNINKKLLQKEGSLSKAEFEEIQKHTNFGLEFLQENELPETYIELVKSHHERLDGSGYPEALQGDQLSEEIRLLAVVDTYSALTLQRSYREPFSSVKAIELLLSKANKYDSKYVINLMELINIYPVNCIVQLSNGKKARVSSVKENQPYLPMIEEIGTSRIYGLPFNFSITIIRFIEWEQNLNLESNFEMNKKEIYWSYFINQFLDGDLKDAMNFFPMLTEGMTANNIFIDVIIRLIKEVEAKRIEGHLSIGEEHDALLKIKNLFNLTYT